MNPTRQQFKQYALRALVDAAVLFLIVKSLVWYTVSTLPPAHAYVLETTGMGLAYDTVTRVVLLTGMFILYSFPSLYVRKLLAILVQAILFFLIIFMFAFIDCRQYIAVVETPNEFIAVRVIPLGRNVFPKNHLPRYDLHDNGEFRYLTFNDNPGQVCKPVWRQDPAANRALDDLLTALQKAKH